MKEILTVNRWVAVKVNIIMNIRGIVERKFMKVPFVMGDQIGSKCNLTICLSYSVIFCKSV